MSALPSIAWYLNRYLTRGSNGNSQANLQAQSLKAPCISDDGFKEPMALYSCTHIRVVVNEYVFGYVLCTWVFVLMEGLVSAWTGGS